VRWFALVVVAACSGDAVVPMPDAAVAEGPDGLVVRFELDDDPSGGLVHATYGLDAACRRCPTRVTGRVGGAHSFDGTLDIAIAELPESFAGPDLTAAAWVRPRPIPGGGGCIIGEPSLVPYRNSWQMCMEQNLTLYACTNDNVFTCESTIALTPDVWTHVAMTYRSATSMMEVYVGAALLSSTVHVHMNGSHRMTIGGDIDEGGVIGSLIGDVDDVRVWNRALSAAEIAAEAAK